MTQTVVITGVSGFIARHVALAFLRAGANIRGTVRSLDKAEAVRRGLAAHDPAAAEPARLSFVAADLTSDAGWREAMAGAGAVMHVASPFPMAQPRDRNALTPAARDGALRVIGAALDAGVPRIVMTASMVTMMYRPGRARVFPVTENDWTDIGWNALSAYVVSKTEAERAAWKLVEERGAKDRFTTVHPGLVVGPVLDRDFGASIELVRMIMSGAYPALPPAAYPIVDVRDVADLHVAASKRREGGGRRLMAVGGVMSMAEMGASLKKIAPDLAAKAPTATLPAFLVRLMALADRNLAAVIPDLGARPDPQADYVAALTGVAARPAKDGLAATARSLAKAGVV
jgi:dihydroflavonol-4-reductase